MFSVFFCEETVGLGENRSGRNRAKVMPGMIALDCNVFLAWGVLSKSGQGGHIASGFEKSFDGDSAPKNATLCLGSSSRSHIDGGCGAYLWAAIVLPAGGVMFENYRFSTKFTPPLALF